MLSSPGSEQHKECINSWAFWSVGAYILAIVIYALPSCYVCMLLSLSVGGLISYRATGSERLMNGTLTLLVAFGALSLPQGYIWSQNSPHPACLGSFLGSKYGYLPKQAYSN